MLDLVAYHNDHGKINRVSEIRVMHPYNDIPFNIRKSTVALFLSELLLKTLREESPNAALFEFMMRSFREYDGLNRTYQNFHIQFLMRYLKYIGLEPVTAADLREGNETSSAGTLFEGGMIGLLMREPYGSEQIGIGKNERLEMLVMITDFISRNLDIDETFRSLAILKEVFD
jgi:DNA repair protein RecO (recombination protein O)